MISKTSNFSGPNSVIFGTRSNVYTLTLGTKLPVLGVTGQSTFPATGWTAIWASNNAALNGNINPASQDDSTTVSAVSLPFTWFFNGTGYNGFFPNSNYYITFGTGSTVFNSLSATNPALNKIFFAGADNSWQRISRITSGTNYTRVRFEGANGTSGTLGSPTMVYELTFFNPSLTGGLPWLELLVGLQARGTASVGIISGIYSPTALLSGGNLGPFPNRGVAAQQSYVMVGSATGSTWTVYTGYYVAGTNY